jgi:hypothetical protein
MTLKSLSTKLYLGIAIAALVMWIGGVPGRTILSLAAVGFMIAMHAGGHGGHGGQADRHDGAAHAGRTGRAASASSSDAPVADAATGTRPGSGSGGCH